MKLYKNTLIYSLEFLSKHPGKYYDPVELKRRIEQCISLYDCVTEDGRVSINTEEIEI
jgi:hypothetical protein